MHSVVVMPRDQKRTREREREIVLAAKRRFPPYHAIDARILPKKMATAFEAINPVIVKHCDRAMVDCLRRHNRIWVL